MNKFFSVKKFLLIGLALSVISFSYLANAYAESGNGSVDLELSFASGPDYSDGSGSYDSGFGFGVGYSLEVTDTYEALIALRYLSWNLVSESTVFGDFNIDLVNTQLVFGGRYNLQLNNKLRVYSGLGFTFNSFSIESSMSSFGTTLASDSSNTETKIGFEPSVGAEFKINEKINAYLDARYELISDFNYFNVALGVSYNWAPTEMLQSFIDGL